MTRNLKEKRTVKRAKEAKRARTRTEEVNPKETNRKLTTASRVDRN